MAWVVAYMLCLEHVGQWLAVAFLATPVVGWLAYEAYLGLRQENGEDGQ